MAVIKTIDPRGQITLGEQYAWHQATVEESEPGVWIIKLGDLIPENERWLHEPEVRAKLDRALAWAAANPPRETDLDELERKILGDR
ncbi:MAG TPA: hypothetical protein VFR03_02655 [Thermoanaerobaculia bacterium]|nr:hypothetical protein [Thermoanaerobaculia bacterium]